MIVSLGFRRALGAVFLTNYRLVLVCDANVVREMQQFRDVASPWLSTADQENMRLKTQQNLSMSIPLGLLASVAVDTSSKASHLTTTLTGESLEANVPSAVTSEAWQLVSVDDVSVAGSPTSLGVTEVKSPKERPAKGQSGTCKQRLHTSSVFSSLCFWLSLSLSLSPPSVILLHLSQACASS